MSLNRLVWLLAIGIIGVSLASLSLGAVNMMPWSMASNDELARVILLDIRLPRVLIALLVGAGVAATGAAIQGVFRNPLADPALIGVSSGAALFASAFMVLGVQIPLLELLGLAGSAFLGGLLTTLLVLFIGRRSDMAASLLLAGVAINAIALSGVSFFTFLAEDGQLRQVAFWALGSLNGVTWAEVVLALVILPLVYLLFRQRQQLDVMVLGDGPAQLLGVSASHVRRNIVLLTAMIVGVSVALVGIIGFIGLIVPHLVRYLSGASHYGLIPLSAMVGALLLLVADLAARTLFLPNELPVGLLTALMGGPFFIYLIVRRQTGFGL